MAKIEKIPLDPDKKKYSYDMRAVKNGYIVKKHRHNIEDEYIFPLIIDALKFIAGSLTGRCKSE